MRLVYKLLLALWIIPAAMLVISIFLLNAGSLGGAFLGIVFLHWTMIAFFVVLAINIIGYIAIRLFFR
jgi:hypothetical protein